MKQRAFTLIESLAPTGAALRQQVSSVAPETCDRRVRRLIKQFTLIELLVVISIIAILAAMLLPALSNARNKAKHVVCASQYDQVGKALFAYFADNERLFPPKNGSSDYEWMGKDGDTSYFSTGHNDIAKRHLNPYFQTNLSGGEELPILHCPGDDGAGSTSIYDATGSSYLANIGENNNGAFNNCTKQSNHHKPNRLTLVESPTRFTPVFSSGFRTYVKGGSIPVEKEFHHSAFGDYRWNLLFVDGHVSFTEGVRGDKVTDDYTMKIDQ